MGKITLQRRKPSILITGCSSGIGYAAAHALHARGWLVIATAREAQDVERLKREGLNAVQLNLQSSDSIAMALDWALRLSDGKIDALFNNAFFAIPAALEDLSRTAFAYQLDSCLLGTHELTLSVLRIMRRQGYGKIINASSVLAIAPMPYRGAYVAAKYALEGLTDVLRLELNGSGISVSLLEMGTVRSNFRKNSYDNFALWINAERSLHKLSYLQMLQRLQSEQYPRSALSAQEVVKVLIKALNAKKPRARYRVGTATKLAALGKKFLSTAMMDKLILRAARIENQYYGQKK